MISREQIKKTATFKKLNRLQQVMILKHKSFKEIDHNLNVVNAIGLEKWRKQVCLNHSRRLIIEEIYVNNLSIN